METITLNNNNNAYSGIKMNPGRNLFSLHGIHEMQLNNFRSEPKKFWIIIQFFSEHGDSLDYFSIDQAIELAVPIKPEYSSYVVILNTNDGEREVSFDLSLIAKN